MQYLYILGLILRNVEYPLLPTDSRLVGTQQIQM